MATTENNGLMIYQDESGNKFILYPITKADLVDGLEELLAGKAAAAHAGQHAGGGSDPITPASIGAALASHNHSASDVTSGTFSTARLPTVPLTKGGTGATTAAAALYALINGASALASSGLATGDYLALGDVSAATGKKVTLANLLTYLESALGGAKIETGSYVGTGDIYYYDKVSTSITLSFIPKLVIVVDMGSEDINPSITPLVITGTGYVYSNQSGGGSRRNKVTEFGTTVTWRCHDNSDGSGQYNEQNATYNYIAFA